MRDEDVSMSVAALAMLAVLTVIVIVFLTRVARSGRRHARISLAAALPRIQTGDLLFTASSAPIYGQIAPLMNGGAFSHAGVFVRGPGGLGISEALGGPIDVDTLALPHGEPARAALYTARSRLENYRGRCFWAPLSRPLDAVRGERARRAAASERPYPASFDLFVSVLADRAMTDEKHCFAHVAWMVDCMGLAPLERGGVPLEAEQGFAIGRAVAALPGQELPDGYMYGAPIELVR